MNYGETEQKEILRQAEKDLLALIAIDPASNTYEVVYTDNSYRMYADRYSGRDFFAAWRNEGILMIAEEDRSRMLGEITYAFLQEKLRYNDTYTAVCRFLREGKPFACEIRVMRDVPEAGIWILRIRDIDEEVRQTEELRTKAMIRSIRPHFLFNVLSSIRELVLEDPETGAESLYDLTVWLRAGLSSLSHEGLISFRQEITNTMAYLRIEKMRSDRDLQVITELQEESFPVVPLCVQILCENAVRHGFAGRKQGILRISSRQETDAWVITVSDNGCGFDPEAVQQAVREGKRDSLGLASLRTRLAAYGGTLQIRSLIGHGTEAEIRIPKDCESRVSAQPV